MVAHSIISTAVFTKDCTDNKKQKSNSKKTKKVNPFGQIPFGIIFVDGVVSKCGVYAGQILNSFMQC